MKKVGYPDTYLLALDILSTGARSCAEVEASGAFVTEDADVRREVDAWLEQFHAPKGFPCST